MNSHGIIGLLRYAPCANHSYHIISSIRIFAKHAINMNHINPIWFICTLTYCTNHNPDDYLCAPCELCELKRHVNIFICVLNDAQIPGNVPFVVFIRRMTRLNFYHYQLGFFYYRSIFLLFPWESLVQFLEKIVSNSLYFFSRTRKKTSFKICWSVRF